MGPVAGHLYRGGEYVLRQVAQRTKRPLQTRKEVRRMHYGKALDIGRARPLS